MKLASVILDIPTQALDTTYTYAVVENENDRMLFSALKQTNQQQAKQPGGTAGRKQSKRHQQVEQMSFEAIISESSQVEQAEAVPGNLREQERPDQSSIHEAFPIEVGCAVLVPFGRRKAVGFVVELEELSCENPAAECESRGIALSKLKEIEQVLSKPYFTEIGARCARFMAERYIAPFASSIRLFMPPGGVPRIERIDGRWELTRPLIHEVDERWVTRLPEADTFVPRKGAVKQQQVLKALQQGDLRMSELTAEYGSVSSTLTSLEKKGVIRIETRRRMRAPLETSKAFSERIRSHVTLTHDQQCALRAIDAASEAASGRVVLVDGVTGSGKTEVYLCAIEKALEAGKGAIVLVPEISLTPQTVARFRGRFGETVAVLHSRMSQGERYDQWDAIRSGAARVVVGARSALFAPMKQVGIVIIDEEHESSYKQDQAPRYVTRDVAEWLVRAHGAVLVLGSATPSLEALKRCEEDDLWQRVEMPNRANGKPLPAIQVVDMAREFGGGNRSMFSHALQTALLETIQKGEKAVLMLNQRGFAQFLLCRDCGFVPSCVSCSTSLTYHERNAKLVCHHCGFERPVPAVCPKCGSPYLKRFGAGTQRVESELKAFLQQELPEGSSCDIIRMDADTTSRKGDHQRLLERFAGAGAAVLLGTQMIAKGLDFDEVTLVGVINADTMLKLPDFRSSERTFDLIEQVAGRAGRADKPGQVIVQTYSAKDPAIRAAARYDRTIFLAEELKLRAGLGYPPFVRLANVLIWGKDEERVKQVAHRVYADIRKALPQANQNPGQGLTAFSHEEDSNSGLCSSYENADTSNEKDAWLVLPPTPCVLERLKGSWRYHIVIKAPLKNSISAYVGTYFRERKPEPDVRVSIDIDPVNLL